MIHISQQIKFKKESETINSIFQDKEIRRKKKQLKELIKNHEDLQGDLQAKQAEYQREKQDLIKESRQLLKEKAAAKQKLFRITVRRNRMKAYQDEGIRLSCLELLKKYMKGYLQVQKYDINSLLGGSSKFQHAQKIIRRIETARIIMPSLRRIVFFQKIPFWEVARPKQLVIVCVRLVEPGPPAKIEPDSAVKLEIYSLTKPYFYISRELLYKQASELIISAPNPLRNLVISSKTLKIQSLLEYFSCPRNENLISSCITRFKAKIQLQKKRKSLLFFRKTTITNIFESINNEEGYQNCSLDVLITVRRIEDDKSVSSRNHEKIWTILKDRITVPNSSHRNKNAFRDSEEDWGLNRQQNWFKKDQQVFYEVSCVTCKKYDSKFRLWIRDTKIIDKYLKANYEQSLNDSDSFDKDLNSTKGFFTNFEEIFKSNFLVQLKHRPQSFFNSIAPSSGKNSRNQKRFIVAINFEQFLPSVLTIQRFVKWWVIKKRLKRLLAKNRLEREKNQGEGSQDYAYNFAYFLTNNKLISVISFEDKIKIRIQSVLLNDKTISEVEKCTFPGKYFHLAEKIIKENGAELIKQNLTWEIYGDIYDRLSRQINQYEEEKRIMQETKPLKTLARLKELFLRVKLRKKKKQNILYIRKISRDFGVLVLIIRRSNFLKNVYDAHLYPLIPSTAVSRNQMLQNISNFSKWDQSSHRYKKISLYEQEALRMVEFFSRGASKRHLSRIPSKLLLNQKLEDEFFISKEHFLARPYKLSSPAHNYNFVYRFAPVASHFREIQLELKSILSEDIHLANLKEEPANKRRRTVVPQQEDGSREKSIMIMKQIVQVFDMCEKNQETRGDGENVHPSDIQDLERKDDFCNQIKDCCLFYSLYQDESAVFWLELFTVNPDRNSFDKIHEEEIKKKDLVEQQINLIYKRVAEWMKKQYMMKQLMRGVLNLHQEEERCSFEIVANRESSLLQLASYRKVKNKASLPQCII